MKLNRVESRSVRKIAIIGQARLNQLIQQWFLGLPDKLDVHVFDFKHDPLQQHRPDEWLSSADLIIDTISGDTATKVSTTEWIARHAAPSTPVLTSILHHTATEISSWAMQKNHFIGFQPLHFNDFRLLEIAPALQTAPEIVQHVVQLFADWGKKVEIIQDQVGGVFPRILALIINEACQAMAEGVAQAESIDIAMKKGTNYPYGPFEWADRIGLEHILWILDGLYREYGDDRYRASVLLKKKIYAGQLGVETKQGFYNYAT